MDEAMVMSDDSDGHRLARDMIEVPRGHRGVLGISCAVGAVQLINPWLL